MCFALSSTWTRSCPRVNGTAATRSRPSCTTITASGSWYTHMPPSGAGNCAGIQVRGWPGFSTMDAKSAISKVCAGKLFLPNAASLIPIARAR